MNRILVVDDDRNVRFSIRTWLRTEPYEVDEAEDGRQAISMIREHEYDAVIMDIRMPGMNGLEALRIIHGEQPHLPVIITTAYGTTETAIETMRSGAYEYLLKPMELKEIKRVLQSALNDARMTRRAVHLPTESASDSGERRIVGSSQQMQEVYKLIGKASRSDAPVLITGPSGSGKELIARALFHYSQRKEKIFQAVNCAAVPESLLESELFGHEKGSFTGAHKTKLGRFERCDGGTLFLDEIGDMPLIMQAKVLRILQEQTFERIGGNETLKVDVRIIAATNRDLEEMVSQGLFREDLYYRLKVITIQVPPLKERKGDIPELLEYFIHRYSSDHGQKVTGISKEAVEALTEYDWPGNARELENAVRRALALTTMQILRVSDFPFLKNGAGAEKAGAAPSEDLRRVLEKLVAEAAGEDDPMLLQQVEKVLLEAAIKQGKGNKVQAAGLLGINRNTLHNKLKKYGINSE